MPYRSKAQERYFHTDTARKHGITPGMVRDFDEASKGMKLPEHKSAARKAVEIRRARHMKGTK